MSSGHDADTRRALTSLTDAQAVHAEFVSNSRRSLCLLTFRLEPLLFDQRDFITAARSLALRSSHSSIRILLRQLPPPSRGQHRLIRLAQDLSSIVQIRELDTAHHEHTEGFLVADTSAVIFRPLADQYEGWCDPHAPGEAARLEKEFNDLWLHGQSRLEWKRLMI